MIALSLVATVTDAGRALDSLHPAFRGMQLDVLVGRFVRLEARSGRIAGTGFIQQLPRRRFAIVLLLLHQQFLRYCQRLLRRDSLARTFAGDGG